MRTTLLATSIGTTRLTVSEDGTRLLLACGSTKLASCLTRRLVVLKCNSRQPTHSLASLTALGKSTSRSSMRRGTLISQETTSSVAMTGTTCRPASGDTLTAVKLTFLVTLRSSSVTRSTVCQ